jgi:diguanylate cyclase (GGDEF)-like protein/PAS domain S-box-containing protein
MSSHASLHFIHQEQFIHLFTKLSDSIIVVDRVGNIMYLNPTAERIFNVKYENQMGQSIYKLIPHYQIDKSNDSAAISVIGIRENNEPFPLKFHSHSLSFGQGSFDIIIAQDLDENIKSTEKISHLNKELTDIKLALDASTIIAITDHQGIIMSINEKFCELSKYNKEELIGQNHRILNSGHHSKGFFRDMWKTIGSGQIWKGELQNKAKDGSLYWVDTTIVPFLNDKGNPYQYISIRTDITQRVKMEMELQEAMKNELRSTQRELQENQQHYQSLFEHSQDAVITYDPSNNIIDMNPKAVELSGSLSSKLPDNSTEAMIIKEYQDIRNDCFEKALQGNPQNFDIVMLNKSGRNLFLNITFLPIIVDKQIIGVYSIGKDITEQKMIQETNAYLAHHDELTKLPNRRWMEQKLHESLIHARSQKQKLAVLFFDLDRFKNINDTLGHSIGDRLLEQLSSRLLASINMEKQFVARMGGDEFMILCPVIADSEEAFETAKGLLENLTTPIHIDDFELVVSASIGISIFPKDGTNVDDLMRNADIALYRSKDQGRNMYQVYSPSMKVRSSQSFYLERDLRKAIMNNEFIAHFQPRVNSSTGKIVSAEALIRWNHPKLGLVSPGEFIPLAEETGLIIPIGKWMKKRVCEQLVAWQEAGIRLVPISVNISSQRFLEKSFSNQVRELLDYYQIEGKWLEFEITENSLMRNEEYIIQTLNELKDLGIKIYIDDFGTGYSSFNYLKSFRLNGIKIDRSFIRNISGESENAPITTAMIKMAQHLKLEVVAEGVETVEELLFLQEQNCHQIQGFLFGKPCSIDEFEHKFF